MPRTAPSRAAGARGFTLLEALLALGILAASGQIDASRLAVLGWSHGAPTREEMLYLSESNDASFTRNFNYVGYDASLVTTWRFLPDLIQLIWDRKIDPGKVFDLTLPIEEAAEAYKAMDERRATKVLLTF